MEIEDDYTGLYDSISAELSKLGGTRTFRNVVQSCRIAIGQARNGGLSWRDVAAAFERAGFPDVKSETVRSYCVQPDAKKLEARRKARARHEARLAKAPAASGTRPETDPSNNVEQRGRPRAVVPDYLL